MKDKKYILYNWIDLADLRITSNTLWLNTQKIKENFFESLCTIKVNLFNTSFSLSYKTNFNKDFSIFIHQRFFSKEGISIFNPALLMEL